MIFEITAERWLKIVSLILVYSSFLTPWLTQTILPNANIALRYVFGDLIVSFNAFPPNVPSIQLESVPNHALIILPLAFEMLFTWLSISRFRRKPVTFEVAGAILGMVPVAFATLDYLKVGYSQPQDFQVSFLPGFFFGLGASLLLLISGAVKLMNTRTTRTTESLETA